VCAGAYRLFELDPGRCYWAVTSGNGRGVADRGRQGRFRSPLGPWTRSAVFGTGVRRVIGLIQSTFATDLEIIAENQNGTYQHWWRDGGGWHPGPTI
jgi:hypothetical protein